MAKKSTVKLRVYKGQKLSYNSDGSIQNENQIITLPHNRVEWRTFLKNIKMHNYIKVDVEDAFYVDKKKDEEGYFVDIITKCTEDEIKAIKQEVDTAFKPAKEEMTPEQRRIAELEAKIELLTKSIKGEVKIDKNNSVEEKDEMELLRGKYEAVVGKKPFNGWDKETLLQKMSEAENK